MKPNFLLITTDQQRWDTIHAAGNDHIFTPNLDWICDQGTRFTRAYSDCPICMPARATILTGNHGFTQGVVENVHEPDPIDPATSLPGLLTRAGYQTRLVGKTHWPKFRTNYGFEHIEPCDDYYRQMAAEGKRPLAHGLGQNQQEPVISTVEEVDSLTHWTVDRSVEFLRTRDQSRPFFLWTSFTKPHPPFDPCRNYWELYRGEPVPDPVYGDWSAEVDDVPPYLMEFTRCVNNVDRYTPRQLAQMRRAYYACITQIDYNLGLLFSELRESGELHNTWIVFTSDHGEMLGDHHMGAKGIPMEASARVPFLLKPPRPEMQPFPMPPGQTCDALVCLADILPTFVGLSGAEIPERDGRSLLETLQGNTRDHLHLQMRDYHALVEQERKLLFAEACGTQLMFNVAKDPYETRELLRVGEDASELRKKMMQRLRVSELKGKRPEDPGIGGVRNRWPGHHSPDVPSDVLH
jgi:arylsulfatase A-like enzyme